MTTHHDAHRLSPTARVLLLASLLIAIGGCTSGKDAGPGAGDDKPVEIPANSFAAAWRAKLSADEHPLQRLVMLEDRLFAFGADRRVFWMNRQTGVLMAVNPIGEEREDVYAPTALADRYVFPTTRYLHVFTKDGKLMHRIAAEYGISSSATGDGEMVFFGIDHPNGGFLVARNSRAVPYDTTSDWQVMTHRQLTARPAAYQGMVFAGSRDGSVYAVRADNRNALWPALPDARFKTDGPILADLAADKDGVFVASTDSKLYCIDMNTGHVRWRYYAGQSLRELSTPVTTSNTVYMVVPKVGLVAIDKGGRQEIRQHKWVLPEATQFLSQDDTYAYVRGTDNAILAVDRTTGKVRFRSARTDFSIFASNTSTKDNLIYAARPDGLVYGIKPVLKPGTVGEIVLEARALEIAAR